MDDGIWLSITEYQNLKQISVSTIRRYIKAGRVKWRLDNKRYFIFMSSDKYALLKNNSISTDAINLEDKLEIDRLKMKLKILEDENNDLKMLVDLYEKDMTQGNLAEAKSFLPELPIG